MELVPITSKLYYTISISLLSAEARDKGKREYRPRVAHPEGYYIKCINWGIRGHNSCFRVQGTYDADRGLYITQIVDDKQRDHVYIETTHNSQPDFQQVLTVFREELERQWEKWKSTTADEGPSLAGAEGDNNFQDGSYKGSASDQSISEAGDANDDTDIGQDLENNHQGASQDPQLELLATPKARGAALPPFKYDNSQGGTYGNIEESFDAWNSNLGPTEGQDPGEQANMGSAMQAQQRAYEEDNKSRVDVQKFQGLSTALEKLDQSHFEAERLEQELEQERLETERLEHERLEAERLEQERLETERLEHERLEAERLEHERLEAERIEQERAHQAEAERLKQKGIQAAAESLKQEALEPVEVVALVSSQTPESKSVQWLKEHKWHIMGCVGVVVVVGAGGWVVLSEAALATMVRSLLSMAGKYVVGSLLPAAGKFAMRTLSWSGWSILRNFLRVAIPVSVVLQPLMNNEWTRTHSVVVLCSRDVLR